MSEKIGTVNPFAEDRLYEEPFVSRCLSSYFLWAFEWKQYHTFPSRFKYWTQGGFPGNRKPRSRDDAICCMLLEEVNRRNVWFSPFFMYGLNMYLFEKLQKYIK